MIILITGATHTGKTALAQRLMVKYEIPYLSIDHLKMGLIRGGLTSLTPEDDEKLTAYLWPIVREIIRTAMENGQSLIIEGCYIPARWFDDFDDEKRTAEIRCFCLIMTEDFIKRHFDDIKKYANIVGKRACEVLSVSYPRLPLLWQLILMWRRLFARRRHVSTIGYRPLSVNFSI